MRKSYPVVIEGESGTGKSAVVSALKDSFGPSDAQVMMVDCAGLSDTPENRDYLENLFAQARVLQALSCDYQDTTILVFDNAGEMPQFAQVGLRSLLDEVERDATSLVGQQTATGLRVVALCRDRLSDAVNARRFRKDLYYMLAGAIVTLPPLRLRENLQEIAMSEGAKIAGNEIELTREAVAILNAHDWPGNIRELRNVLQRALLEGNGHQVSLLELQFLKDQINERSSAPNKLMHRSIVARHVHDEKTMLVDALNTTQWNVSEAARLLGIGRATINRKIKHHGLTRPN